MWASSYGQMVVSQIFDHQNANIQIKHPLQQFVLGECEKKRGCVNVCVCVCVWLVNGMLRGVSLGLCTYILSTPAGFRTVGLLLVDDDNWLRGGGGREVNIHIIDWNKLEDSTFCTVTVERFRSSLLLSPVQKETKTKTKKTFSAFCVCLYQNRALSM